jgi:hypothetical protein
MTDQLMIRTVNEYKDLINAEKGIVEPYGGVAYGGGKMYKPRKSRSRVSHGMGWPWGAMAGGGLINSPGQYGYGNCASFGPMGGCGEMYGGSSFIGGVGKSITVSRMINDELNAKYGGPAGPERTAWKDSQVRMMISSGQLDERDGNIILKQYANGQRNIGHAIQGKMMRQGYY